MQPELYPDEKDAMYLAISNLWLEIIDILIDRRGMTEEQAQDLLEGIREKMI